MIVVYCCPTGVHGALIASGIHLGLLPTGFTQARLKLCQLSGYNSYRTHQQGGIRVMGKDAKGYTVAALGVARDMDMVKEVVTSFCHLWGKEAAGIHLVEVGRFVDGWRYIMWHYCHKIGLGWLGNWVMASSVKKCYDKITQVVTETMGRLD